MSEPRPAADDLTGDFLFAIGPEADASLFKADGFTGIGTGACMPAAASVGAALAVATGGTLRGWAPEA